MNTPTKHLANPEPPMTEEERILKEIDDMEARHAREFLAVAIMLVIIIATFSLLALLLPF